MLSVVEALKRTPFVANVAVVMSGTVVSQAVGIAMSPVVSRLFTPDDFGVFGTFSAISTVMAAVVTLDYSQAVMLPKSRDDAGQVLLLSFATTAVITAAAAVVCLLSGDRLLGLLGSRNGWLLGLLVVSVFCAGVNASLQAWCVRVKAFSVTASSQVLRGVTSTTLQVFLGLASTGSAGLVLSSVIADGASAFNLARVTSKQVCTFLAGARVHTLKRLFVEYRDFPMYSATQNLLNAVSNGLPVLLLTHFYGLAVAGAYAFGVRLLSVPMSLVLGALRQVLFQKAAELQHQDRPLSSLFMKSTLGLLGIGVLPTAALVAWSPALFSLLFGGQWRTAGEYSRYLAVWLLFAFCNLPAVLCARLIRMQRTLLLFEVLFLAIRASVLAVGGLYLNALASIAAFSVVGAAMNVLLVMIVAHRLLRHEGATRLAHASAEC